jgi:hypothetical protein
MKNVGFDAQPRADYIPSMLTLCHASEAIAALDALPRDGAHVRQTLLSTFSELWCDAELYAIPAERVAGPLEAFVCLWASHVSWVEELDGSRNPDGVRRQMAVALRGEQGARSAPVFAPLSKEDWERELGVVVRGILGELGEVRAGRKRSLGRPVVMAAGPLDRADPRTYWGVFLDGQRVDERSIDPGLVPGEYVDGIAIRRVWNHMELFVRTTEVFALFAWSTGA